MKLQDTRFMSFMLNFWIKYQKFKGASKICAIFLNCLFLIVKLVFCGIILVIYAPHVAANSLLNKQELTLLQRVLYGLAVVVSLVIDIPLLFGCVVSTIMVVQFIIKSQFIEAILFGLVAWALAKMELTLIKSLFYKSVIEEPDEEEEVNTEEKEQPEEEIEELPFCQLFNLNETTCIMVDHVEMCPDETAFIRVVDEEAYTTLYKRKVKRNRVGDRFFQLNGTNYYLDDKKTQPIIVKK